MRANDMSNVRSVELRDRSCDQPIRTQLPVKSQRMAASWGQVPGSVKNWP